MTNVPAYRYFRWCYKRYRTMAKWGRAKSAFWALRDLQEHKLK